MDAVYAQILHGLQSGICIKRAVYPNRVQERIVMHLHNCILWQISEGVSYISLMDSFYYTHHTDQK